ncbi:MAG: hypothetical protein IPI29_08015 [Ignavibacteria bacterium]|nr:hypothetical protein [Ignavibacteria bacterium]
MVSPSKYRAAAGTLSDAEYVMTQTPISITGLVRNIGGLRRPTRRSACASTSRHRHRTTARWPLRSGTARQLSTASSMPRSTAATKPTLSMTLRGYRSPTSSWPAWAMSCLRASSAWPITFRRATALRSR